MILIDYSQIALSNIIVQKLNDESMIRHMILNSIRMYNKKHRDEYGQVVICADGMNTWRKDFFPEYKAHRRKNRDESDQDWNEIFRILHTVRDEIRDYLPYKVIHMEGVEADDIIGTLVMQTQEFGMDEPVMIISSDKDFIQLQKYDNVKQYSPITKKLVDGVDPKVYIKEHVLKGDKSDGVPNVLSPDHTFTDELRQRPLTSKKLESILAQDIDELDDEIKRNYQRNDKLINLDNIPKTLESEILNSFNEASYGDRSGLLNYFIEKRLTSLTENIGEF